MTIYQSIWKIVFVCQYNKVFLTKIHASVIKRSSQISQQSKIIRAVNSYDTRHDYMKDELICPHCGKSIEKYRNPFPTVDIIIEINDSIVLIERKNPPFGWALPGGFVDYGESLETAAKREAMEETSLDVELISQFGAYSDPGRDPRHHTISVVFIGRAQGVPCAADDAAAIGLFNADNLPEDIAFDHRRILQDYFYKKTS